MNKIQNLHIRTTINFNKFLHLHHFLNRYFQINYIRYSKLIFRIKWNYLILMFLERSLHSDYIGIKFIKIGWVVHELWFFEYLIIYDVFDRGQKRHKTLFKNHLFQNISNLKDQKWFFLPLCTTDNIHDFF